jgi:membrane dipeptidase
METRMNSTPNRSISPLHSEAIVLDAAVPLITPRSLPKLLSDLVAGGVDAVMVTVASLEDCRYTIGQLAKWRATLRETELPVRLATTVADVRAAKRDGDIAIGLHFQGGNPIEADIDLIDVYAELGVRVVQLTYNTRNLIGDGCLEETDVGLSKLGRQVVRRLNDLRMAIDISHVGVRTSLEAIEASAAPVIASHANARGVHESPRNLTDDQIKAVAASGGAIGLCAFPSFVGPGDPPVLDDLLRHADYIAGLVGPEHIGLGMDFAIEDEDDFVYYGYDLRYYPMPPWTWPTGIGRFFLDMPNLTDALQRRGYADVEIRGMLGENFLRVFENIWGG